MSLIYSREFDGYSFVLRKDVITITCRQTVKEINMEWRDDVYPAFAFPPSKLWQILLSSHFKPHDTSNEGEISFVLDKKVINVRWVADDTDLFAVLYIMPKDAMWHDEIRGRAIDFATYRLSIPDPSALENHDSNILIFDLVKNE